MQSVNPATGEVHETYDRDDDATVAAALDRADEAATAWAARPIREREELIDALGDVFAENAEEYGALVTAEMGKPIAQAVGEVQICASICEHYAEHAGTYLQDETHASPAGVDAKTAHEPLGILLGVMPWNFPFYQVVRFAAPAIAAGNVTVLKHAPEVPGCADAIADAFDEAGIPEGVFQSLRVDVDAVHEQILPDDRVRGATLTGSPRAGAAIAETAGSNLKKSVLELGGSDPYIVLEDADVAAATASGVWARMLNAGQACTAAKRMLVHEDVYDEFEERLVAGVEGLTLGDPTDPDTDVGPMVSEGQRDRLVTQVEDSVAAGASVLLGGDVPDREGVFYEPTVLADVPEGAPAIEEELFGPVAVLYEVADEDEAVEVANDTNYGLGASVWTEDRDRGEDIARRIDAGMVAVNTSTPSDPRVPFGGVKDSGYGRELGEAGIKEWVNRKTVWVE